MAYEVTRCVTMTPVSGAVRQKRFVEMNGAEIQEVSVSGGDAVGVASEASAASDQAVINMALLDGAKITVVSGAAVVAGVRVMSDDQGRAITATGATARVLGVALSASGAAGEEITILAKPASGEFVA